jgi:hypothetical protein
MTKQLLFLFSSIFFFSLSTAQVNPNAIGLRSGGGYNGSFGGEISYQKGFGSANRLEIDFGWTNRRDDSWKNKTWRYNQFAVSGIYHWVFNLTEGLNWFIGPGAQIGFFDDYYNENSGISLAIGGQIGIEYDFNKHGVPLLFGFDARPMLDFVGYYSGFGGGVAASLRYTF